MARIDMLLRRARPLLEPGEAEYLLAHACGRDRTWLFTHGDHELDASSRDAFDDLVARRHAGEPVAYLTGRRGFWTLDLAVTPATLVPRPETERLVELALERLPPGPCRAADLGTGSGAIALALATQRPDVQVVATDASVAALDVARLNAARCGAANVDFRPGDWWGPLRGERFHVIASNPPYIAKDDPHLAQGDLRFEPMDALASGADGLDALRVIAAGAAVHLAPGGWLLVEHGVDQGAAVRALFEAAGLHDVATAQDLECRDRVTSGRRG